MTLRAPNSPTLAATPSSGHKYSREGLGGQPALPAPAKPTSAGHTIPRACACAQPTTAAARHLFPRTDPSFLPISSGLNIHGGPGAVGPLRQPSLQRPFA